MYLLKMPKADENMSEGTVARWLVEAGAEVEVEEDLVECVADKGEFMVYAEQAGKLLRIFAPDGSVVPVGYVLAAVGDAAEMSQEAEDGIEKDNAELIARSREELAATQGLTKRRPERVRATPAARTLAKELGVALADVSASIGGKLVREDDVRAFSAQEADRKEEGGE
jgi:pyruvate/2-oxoglutarate dehydrogenase complex dihydrolipoamide acyltransferase (E2) component